MLGGPLGALFGAAFGHNFDRGMKGLDGRTALGEDTERIQAAFFTGTFSVMGHLAKADGQVSRVEIHLAEDIMRQMQLSPDQKRVAQELFNQGKKAGFPIDDALQQLRMECNRRRNLLQMFMEIQVATALSDGTLHPGERRVLEKAAHILGFSRQAYEAILQRMQAQRHAHAGPRSATQMSLQDAYDLLGIDPGAGDQEVKKAYRRQMNQHHPDKLVSKGLPEEMMEMANRKVQDIRQAYETIRASRKN